MVVHPRVERLQSRHHLRLRVLRRSLLPLRLFRSTYLLSRTITRGFFIMTGFVSFMAIFWTSVIFYWNFYMNIAIENNQVFNSPNTSLEWHFQVNPNFIKTSLYTLKF